MSAPCYDRARTMAEPSWQHDASFEAFRQFRNSLLTRISLPFIEKAKGNSLPLTSTLAEIQKIENDLVDLSVDQLEVLYRQLTYLSSLILTQLKTKGKMKLEPVSINREELRKLQEQQAKERIQQIRESQNNKKKAGRKAEWEEAAKTHGLSEDKAKLYIKMRKSFPHMSHEQVMNLLENL